jgi:hypothetical protein
MRPFRRRNLHHILRAAREVTAQTRFVVIGSTALIARLKHVPLEMMMSPEADIYSEEDDESVAALIDGVLGQGSDFHACYGSTQMASRLRLQSCPSIGNREQPNMSPRRARRYTDLSR